jgi:hypothetical protein
MRPADVGQPFVTGVLETAVGPVPRVGTRLTSADTIGHWRVRWGIRRDDYKVDPGLYAVGSPDDTSPVLVTANYKLTFDVLRSAVDGISAWVLVLDTRGINVWCAAGKGTFSTEELIGRIRNVRLEQLVSHHRVIVPQLGATGVAAHEVRKHARFAVVYGPVRATDIPAFLSAGLKASAEMREPTFTMRERLVLAPVELVGMVKPTLWVALAVLALGLAFTHPLTPAALGANMLRNAAPYLLGALGGAVLTPLLLPWLPPRAFAAKGAVVGLALGAVLALGSPHLGSAAASLLLTAAVASYVAMNFTGSTPFTSLSGVEREMRRWMPLQAAGAALAVLAIVAGSVLR